MAERMTKPWETPDPSDLVSPELEATEGTTALSGSRPDPYELQRGEKRRMVIPDDDVVEESLPVLFLVLRRACSGISGFKAGIKEAILPDDL